MEPISDDELQRLRNRLRVMDGPMCAEMPAVYVTKTELHGLLARLDAAESRAADADRMQRRIERLESKLDAWHNLYGSEDWRSVLAAEMEVDHE